MYSNKILACLCFASTFTIAQGGQRFRLYSIECQKNGRFALISYFNTNELLLSYGKNDDSIEIDLEVKRFKKSLHKQFIELFQTHEKEIELQIHQDSSKIKGIGHLSVTKNNQLVILWKDLNCLRYGKD